MLFNIFKRTCITAKINKSSKAVKKSNPFPMSLFKTVGKKPITKHIGAKVKSSDIKLPSADLQRTIEKNQILYAELLSNKMYRLKSDY